MSKGIFLVFCVAILFSSGLVLANPSGGSRAAEGLNQIGTSLEGGVDTLADAVGGNDTVLGGVLGGIGGLIGGVGETGGEILNGTANKLEKSIPNTFDKAANGALTAATGGVGHIDTLANLAKAGTNAANAGAKMMNAKAQAQGAQNAQALNGGNTVQIPTIFFMVLAIFNN